MGNIQPSHLWEDDWSNTPISKPARVVNVFGVCAWVVKTFVFAALGLRRLSRVKSPMYQAHSDVLRQSLHTTKCRLQSEDPIHLRSPTKCLKRFIANLPVLFPVFSKVGEGLVHTLVARQPLMQNSRVASECPPILPRLVQIHQLQQPDKIGRHPI